jgi:putative ABC transport system permease protein
LTITFADGASADLTVGATYEISDFVGGYVLPAETYAPHTHQPVDSMVVVDLADGTALADGKVAVEQVAANVGGPDVEDRDEFAASMSAGADMLLTIIYALLALAIIIIALMGIATHCRCRSTSAPESSVCRGRSGKPRGSCGRWCGRSR